MLIVGDVQVQYGPLDHGGRDAATGLAGGSSIGGIVLSGRESDREIKPQGGCKIRQMSSSVKHYKTLHHYLPSKTKLLEYCPLLLLNL